jgi:oxygen-independent coproporphyrinogen-3 oxidase
VLADGRSPVAGREIIAESQRRMERLYLGLRTAAGVELELVPPARAQAWVRQGWASLSTPAGRRAEAPRIQLTAAGWLRLDELVASL